MGTYAEMMVECEAYGETEEGIIIDPVTGEFIGFSENSYRRCGRRKANLPTRFVVNGEEIGLKKLKDKATRTCKLRNGASTEDAIWALEQYGYDILDRRSTHKSSLAVSNE